MNASTVLATQEHAKTRVGATNAHVHQNGREAIARVSHKIKCFFAKILMHNFVQCYRFLLVQVAVNAFESAVIIQSTASIC